MPDYTGFYDRYLKNTVAKLLLSHGFTVARRPDDRHFDPDACWDFSTADVEIEVCVVPAVIQDVIVGSPWAKPGPQSAMSLSQLLRRRGCPIRIDAGPDTLSEARAIVSALEGYCQDVLAGELPKELIRPTKKSAKGRTAPAQGVKKAGKAKKTGKRGPPSSRAKSSRGRQGAK